MSAPVTMIGLLLFSSLFLVLETPIVYLAWRLRTRMAPTSLRWTRVLIPASGLYLILGISEAFPNMVALLVFSVALTRILTTATILLFCLVLKASIEYEYYRVSISSWKRWLTIIAAISGIPLLVTSQIQVVPFAPEDFRLLSSHNFMVASYMVRYYHLVAKGALFGSSIFLWTRTDCKKLSTWQIIGTGVALLQEICLQQYYSGQLDQNQSRLFVTRIELFVNTILFAIIQYCLIKVGYHQMEQFPDGEIESGGSGHKLWGFLLSSILPPVHAFFQVDQSRN